MFSAVGGMMSGLASSALNHASNFLGSSVGQSLIGGAASLGGDFTNGLIGHFFGKKSSKYNAQKQREMANYMMKLQKQYNSWLIPFQNESNMEYQLRYANGRPQAEVAGLRAAGLNPILAASGGFHSGSMPGSTASSVSSSPSSGYVPSSAKGTRYYDPLLSRQMDLLDAQIVGQKIKNNNDMKNRGLSGQYGALSRLISESGIRNDDPTSSHRPRDFQDVLDSIGEFLGTRLGNDGKAKPNPYIKTSPRTSDALIRKLANEDTPPSMRQHQNYIESDGFNLRDWHRLKRKIDGKYMYRKRELWHEIYRR